MDYNVKSSKMKRYKLIDNKTGKVFEYSSFMWGLVWRGVYIIGVLTGILIGYYLNAL